MYTTIPVHVYIVEASTIVIEINACLQHVLITDYWFSANRVNTVGIIDTKNTFLLSTDGQETDIGIQKK